MGAAARRRFAGGEIAAGHRRRDAGCSGESACLLGPAAAAARAAAGVMGSLMGSSGAAMASLPAADPNAIDLEEEDEE